MPWRSTRYGEYIRRAVAAQHARTPQALGCAEELPEDPAGLAASEHPDVMLLGSENVPDPALEKRVLELELVSRGSDHKAALARLKEMVPAFQPATAHLA